MAKKRMFDIAIVGSDAFLDLPHSAQALYVQLSMRADDDGFIGNPKTVQRIAGVGQEDLEILARKRFILVFKSGVVVIKHWKINNNIQKDRYTKTVYTEEYQGLRTKDNKSYTEADTNDKKVYTECIQNVSRMDTQYSIDKNSIDKDSIDKDSIGESEGGKPPTPKKEKKFISPSIDEVTAYCAERRNGVNPKKFHAYYESNGWMVGKRKMRDWKAAVRYWENDKANSKPFAYEANYREEENL